MTDATAGAMMTKQVQLYWFREAEFNRGGQNWYPLMCPRLLVLLDVARTMWGAPVRISQHPRAVGRCSGRDNTSQHNFERWNEVRAVDVFLEGTEERRSQAFYLLRELGFTGIGVYPEWRNGDGFEQLGFHLDTRRRDPATGDTVVPGYPQTWGYLRGEYTSAERAFA